MIVIDWVCVCHDPRSEHHNGGYCVACLYDCNRFRAKPIFQQTGAHVRFVRPIRLALRALVAAFTKEGWT